MSTLTLPKLAGSRDMVLRLLVDIPHDLSQAVLVVDASNLASAAPSFADQLCKEVLQTRSAHRLEVRGASERFRHFLTRSADARGLSDRLLLT